MDEQDVNTETGRPRDVFAEVAEIAVGAAFADTAARRLAAGDIAHALGAAYPELAAAALRRKPAPRLRWTWEASASGIRYMTATDADGMIVFAGIFRAHGGWEVFVRRGDTYALVAAASGIRSLKLARSVARGMVKGVFGWARRRARQHAARAAAKAGKEA